MNNKPVTKENIISSIIEYFENNSAIFSQCIEQLDSYNGYLVDNRYYSMDMLDELFCDTSPIDLLNRAFFGHDEDNWVTNDRGEKEYARFNPNREYFRLNGYGNFVSTDYPDYTDFLDWYFVEQLIENQSEIDAIEEEPELFDLFSMLNEIE